MFNIYKNYSNTYHPNKLEVKEYKAPTDESIKILRDMEQKMLDNIISMGKVEDNIFNVKWYIYPDQHSWEDRCRCVFTLNNEKHDFDFLLSGKFTNTSEVIPAIREKILDRLTGVLGMNLLKNCGNTIREKYSK